MSLRTRKKTRYNYLGRKGTFSCRNPVKEREILLEVVVPFIRGMGGGRVESREGGEGI